MTEIDKILYDARDRLNIVKKLVECSGSLSDDQKHDLEFWLLHNRIFIEELYNDFTRSEGYRWLDANGFRLLEKRDWPEHYFWHDAVESFTRDYSIGCGETVGIWVARTTRELFEWKACFRPLDRDLFDSTNPCYQSSPKWAVENARLMWNISLDAVPRRGHIEEMRFENP